jgi:Sulfotransferase family
MPAADSAAELRARSLPLDPVIVTGVPRSGVRLLAAILDGHTALGSGPDLPVIATLVQQWQEIHANLAEHHERNHRVPPDRSRAAFRDAVLKLFAPRLDSTGKKRFVLQSFTAAALLEQFASLFRDARFILTVRDPHAIACSLLKCDWRDVRTGKALAYTRNPVAAARFTAHHLTSALQNVRQLQSKGRLMVLRYEGLCADPAGTMAQVASFLDEAVPYPFVSQSSADLVTRSADNAHPSLRSGAVDANSLRRHNALEPGPMTAAIERLRWTLGYRGHDRWT